MNTLVFSSIQTLTKEQVHQVDESMFSLVGVEAKEMAWKQVYNLLKSLTIDQTKTIQDTYIKWYAWLSWGNLFYSIPKVDIAHVINTTFVSALRQDARLWEQVVTYLHLKAVDETEMQSLYNNIREELMHSTQVLCTVKGQEITLGNFFDSLLRYEDVEDGLELAQYLSDVEFGFAATLTDTKYYTIEPAKAINVLRDFAHFLSGVKPNRIFVVVDAYMYPQKYERLKVDASGEGAEIVEPEDDVEAMVPVSPPVTENTSAPEEDFNVFAYINDAAGTDLVQEVETSKVISLLQTLATEKGNPRIADVYFFNEQTGAFAWDEALLRELKLIPEDFDMSVVDVDKKDMSE